MKKSKSTGYHDKIAEEYEEEYETPFWQLENEITWNNIKKYLPKKGGLILDAGGGTGFWSRRLAKQGFRMVCSDITHKMLDVGKVLAEKEGLLNKIKFTYSDITNMKEFEDGSFDFVLAEGDPVGYCGNPKKAVKELARVAKKGAFIVVSVDSFFAGINSLLKRKEYKKVDEVIKTKVTDFGQGFPTQFFTVDDLKDLFQSCSLKLVEVIGKQIMKGFSDEMLKDKKLFNKVLEVENKFNNKASIIGMGHHIQIVGKKV